MRREDQCSDWPQCSNFTTVKNLCLAYSNFQNSFLLPHREKRTEQSLTVSPFPTKGREAPIIQLQRKKTQSTQQKSEKQEDFFVVLQKILYKSNTQLLLFGGVHF